MNQKKYAVFTMDVEAFYDAKCIRELGVQTDVSLLDYSLTPGTVSFDGQTATLVLDAQIRSREGGDAQIVRESVPLERVQDNWAIRTQTLRSLMIRD